MRAHGPMYLALCLAACHAQTGRPRAPTAAVVPADAAAPRSHEPATRHAHAERSERVEALRAELLRRGVAAASITTRDADPAGTVLILESERPSDAESDTACEAHAGYLVADEGSIELPTSAFVREYAQGGLACETVSVHLEQDPHVEPALLASERDPVGVVRLGPNGFSVAATSCRPRWLAGYCGHVALCPDGSPVAVESDAHALVVEDACLDARNHVLARARQAEGAVHEAVFNALGAVRAYGHDVDDDTPHPMSAPGCRRASAAQRARASRRIRDALLPDYTRSVLQEGRETPPSDAEIRRDLAHIALNVEPGCVDASGSFLARVTTEDMPSEVGPIYAAIWRATPTGAALLEAYDDRTLTYSLGDLTGDGVPEMLLAEGVWEAAGGAVLVLSPSWGHPLVLGRDDAPDGRSNGLPAVTLVPTRPRGAALVVDAVVQAVTEGRAAPATTGYDAVRTALARIAAARAEREALAHALDTLLDTPRERLCDHDALIAIGNSLLGSLTHMGVPRAEARTLVGELMEVGCHERARWEAALPSP